MIMRALDHGVTEERIATTLSVNAAAIRAKRDLLSGICPETVAHLKDREMTAMVLREIRKATPMRQIEMAELTNRMIKADRSQGCKSIILSS